MTRLKPVNEEDTKRFLEKLDPEDCFTFQTFDDTDRKRKSLTHIFHGSLEEHWASLKKLNAQGAGIFVCVNQTDLAGRKSENIKRVRAVFADLDGAPLEPVLDYELAPHIVTESSPNRWHVFWLVNGLNPNDFGSIQKEIAQRFQGDPSVTDLPRVMRIPGFFHHKGKPFLSRLHYLSNQRIYTSDEIKAAFPRRFVTPTGSSLCIANESEVRRICEALCYLDPQDRDLWVAVGHALKIELGERGLEIFQHWSKQRPDGSIPINYQNQEDVARFWEGLKPNRTSINSILRKAEQAGFKPLGPSIESTGESRDDGIEAMVDRLNKDWFVVFQGGKVWVCRGRKDIATGQEGIEKFTPEEHNKAFANKTRSIGNKIQKDSIIWFQHPRRREYPMGIVCDPTDKVDGLYFNTWQGLAIDPSNSDPKFLVDHIEKIIASGDKEVADYVKGWLAHSVQQPEKPAGVVLVLRGGQGTGKGLLGTAMLRIFGKHGLHIVQAEHLVGRFQGHLEDCVFLFSDESFFPGDPRIKGQLKSLITERCLTMEEKYVQAKPVLNRLSILMASNEKFVVPAELDDRRFAVIDVSETQKNNREYFNDLWRTVDGPGLSGFVQYLLDYDISKFDIRDIPETTARTEQKEFLFDTGLEFIAWSLRRGCFYDGYAYDDRHDFFEWHEFLSTQLLYSFYEHWYKNERPRGKKLRQNELGERLTKFLTNSRPSGDSIINIRRDKGERPHGYKFESLQETRRSFEKAFRLKNFSWPEADAPPIIDSVPF